MSYAIVFSGQGTQHAGMLPWLGEDPLLQEMRRLLGCVDWRSAMADGAWASRNANAQVLLTGTALAAWQSLAEGLPAPACIAGYSVGELAAFSAAGVFDASTALALAQRRAAEMDRCGLAHPGGLMAVLGLPTDALGRLLNDTGLDVAIRNAPDHVVLGGAPDRLEHGEQGAVALGARVQRLCITVASHTPAMQEAADRFTVALERMDLARPTRILFSNVIGRVRTAADALQALGCQIAQTVRWDECMEDIRARSPTCVIEVGPGQALARLWNQRFPDVPARSCDEFHSVESLTRWVKTRT